MKQKIIVLLTLCALCFGLFCGCTTPSDMGDDSSLAPNVPSTIDSLGGDAGVVAPESSVPKGDFSALNNTSHGWGQGNEKDANGVPVDCNKFNQTYGKYNAIFVEKPEKILYLTFDQGYENGYTGKILDTLKAENVPATFFLTYEYLKTESALIQHMVDEGHTLGNHSTKHKSFPTLNIDTAREDIANMHGLIKDQFGVDMSLFRFPMGEYSERMLALVQDFGYKSVFWSFAYKDWLTDAQPDPTAALQKLKDSLHPGGIYLLHSVSSTNAQILGEFIAYAKSQGYTFQTPK